MPSASLIPNDPQLLFTVAGWSHLPIFWGKVEPTYTRVTTCQNVLEPRYRKWDVHLDIILWNVRNFSFMIILKKNNRMGMEFLTKELNMNSKIMGISL